MNKLKQYSATELAAQFERHLSQITLPEDPERLYAPIRYALSGGGKRMRPTLTLLAYNIFADDIERALPAATAVEVFHNFTLLHDDIMDNADVRRGRPSVPAKWGENVALLSGDAMLIAAYSFLAAIPAESIARVMKVFNTMAAGVCEGQQYDMDFETRNRVSVAEYMHMIELKTAVLLAGAAEIGAILAGASDDDCKKINRFATELGMAFQLQDDLLDSYGDERLGKKIGGDILEGKQTYLMITALSHADEAQREILRHTYKRTDLTDEEKIETVRQVFDTLNIPHLTRQQIAIRFARAIEILTTLSVPAERVAEMQTYAESLMERNY